MASFEEVKALSSEDEESKNSSRILSIQRVHEDEDEESKHSSRWGFRVPPLRSLPFSGLKIAVLAAACLAAATLFFQSSKPCKPREFVNFGALQGKSAVDLEANMALKATSLKRIQSRKLADEVVMKTMKAAGQEYSKHYYNREVRALPADPADAAREMLTKEEAIAYRAAKKNKRLTEGRTVFCAFNVLEAFVSVVGLGDDINAIIRVCPPPRDGESELACQVDAAILVAWVGNAAAKLSFAASNCATTIKVNALCGVGVTGLVSVVGELAATASLAAATCTATPPSLTTTAIGELGDQTVRRGRRLLVGEGRVGVGLQCFVDVGMVASNIANMGISIFQAVQSGSCGHKALSSPVNKLTGIPEALCTVDIGGAIAYIGQVVTFINLVVVHCQDFLDVSALCGASIAGITTAAAAVAPYGAAVHAACARNAIAKDAAIQAKINSLYTVPSLHRRLNEVEDAVGNLKTIRRKLEQHLGLNVTGSSTAVSRADLENMIQLIDGGVDEEKRSTRGSLIFSDECKE